MHNLITRQNQGFNKANHATFNPDFNVNAEGQTGLVNRFRVMAANRWSRFVRPEDLDALVDGQIQLCRGV